LFWRANCNICFVARPYAVIAMNPLATGVNSEPTLSRTAVIADWADVLTQGARETLDRMDTTLTLAEAKVSLIQHLRERRREWEAARFN
jgi:predicted ATPase with chaperone activity